MTTIIELSDEDLDDIFTFYKDKYKNEIKNTIYELSEITNQRQPRGIPRVQENEVLFSELWPELLANEQATQRLDEWLSTLNTRTKYAMVQIVQEIAEATLMKEIDSGEEFLRDLLVKHRETMLNIIDPVIRRKLTANASSYVLDITEEEVQRDFTDPNQQTEEEAEEARKDVKKLLSDIVKTDPNATEYLKNLTQNRKIKQDLLKDRKIDHALTGGKDMKDIINGNSTSNCLKEENDLKNLRITLNESLEAFNNINIKDKQWETLKNEYLELNKQIAEQEVVKTQLASYKSKCNIM
jgi:hypothetical protein|uniref:Uncharacterized protein n=1 Tax=viral metagenome TaxID=1070528 RepID=A0A6C0J4S5_9ZZZZ